MGGLVTHFTAWLATLCLASALLSTKAHAVNPCVALGAGSLQVNCTSSQARFFGAPACDPSSLLVDVSLGADAHMPHENWRTVQDHCHTKPTPALTPTLAPPCPQEHHIAARPFAAPGAPVRAVDAAKKSQSWLGGENHNSLPRLPQLLPASHDAHHLSSALVEMAHRVRRESVPDPLPGCSYAPKTAGTADDDDSRWLMFPEALHCSNASLGAVPSPLPAAAQYLMLGHNQLTSLAPSDFPNLPNLINLWLNNNELTSIAQGTFANMPNLTLLGMYFNHLSVLPPTIFANLTKLTYLGIGWNSLTFLPLQLFENLTLLTFLLMAGNQFTTLPKALFAPLTSLTYLYLGNNLLTSLELGIFNSLTHLILLDLSANQFPAVGTHFFSSMLALVEASNDQGECNALTFTANRPCPAYIQSLNILNINVSLNAFSSISKSAFDTLPAYVSIILAPPGQQLVLPASAYCCGLGWLEVHRGATRGSDIVCGGMPLATYTTLPQCACKAAAYQSNATLCAALVNYTSTINGCSTTGCDPGQRVYRTGPVLLCNDTGFFGDTFTLYETACQNCLPANCSRCQASLMACDACLPGTLLLFGQCVMRCEDLAGLYSNYTAGQCRPCPFGCATCTSTATAVQCQTCAPSFGLFHAACLPCDTPGLQLDGCIYALVSKTTVPLEKVLPPVLIGFALLATVAVLVYRRFRRTTSELTVALLETQEVVAEYRAAWEIGWHELAMFERIGQGAMGAVWRARWRDMDVAVKLLTGVHLSNEQLRTEVDREASMLHTLRHAHVVQFFGAGASGEGVPYLVTELVALGSLTSLLRANTPLDWATRTRFAFQISSGMALVHSLGRMHRDLKSGNILVRQTQAHGDLHVKVADFGTASMAGSMAHSLPVLVESASQTQSLQMENVTRGVGTPLWMAPEILKGQSYGPSADLYSYAIVLWEIAARDQPWRDVNGSFLMDELLVRIRAGTRPPLQDDWPAAYVSIMTACWAMAPEDRPAFSAVMAQLKDMGASDK